MEKTTVGRIVDIREVDEDFIIIRGLFEGRKGIIVTEDLIIQVKNLKEKDFKIGSSFKIVEKENKLYIIIEKVIP